jgi:predicted flap endonuclease-1-like 5' DNA nuclease
MNDLAFHTFLILFFCGLVGMLLGWCCRAIFANNNTPQQKTPAKTKLVPNRKAVGKKVSIKKTGPKTKRKTKSKPKAKPKRKTNAVKKDDLKIISGVGPVLEKKLNKQGIKTFAQIAAWKKADVVKFDKVLDFKGRIEREEWVKQAKALAKKNP